ncbi:MAG: hypothetical protein KC657_19530, partial [Myxococcales bacterium]|nr:hypothetical protein [Myxococcales bacterium]
MIPLVGWHFGGPVVRPRAQGVAAWFGQPTWSAGQLLRDLEMRLGLPPSEAAAAVRVPVYARRLAAVMKDEPFFSRSFTADALGTAKTLLAWRDALLDAGWTGQSVADGGDRLDSLAAVEACDEEALPAGRADRLVRVETELRAVRQQPYDGLALAEPRDLWSARWRAIFGLLEERGVAIEQLAPELAQAPAESDLGILQRMLRGELAPRRTGDPPAIRGDGTLRLVHGDTPAELAELTAGFLARQTDSATVVRCAESGTLDAALGHHGLACQGHAGSSAWRPAMQLLPLALELSYEPRDPYRVLELLTLPVGPFQGALGAQLARAVSRQPGVGGSEWKRQKDKGAERLREWRLRHGLEAGKSQEDATRDADAFVAERMQRVADWVEAAGFGPEGAPRRALLEVTERVRTLLQRRLAVSPEGGETYGAAHAQAQAMTDALARDHRETLTREQMRNVLDGVVRGEQSVGLMPEQAGRIDHVDHPGALLAPSDTVVFWAFVGGT